MTDTGRILRRLTRDPKYDADPTWSPDGRRIAFYSQRTSSGEVFVVNADGTGLKNLTRNPAHDGGASWSPDGQSIVFDSDRASGAGIYVMRANGTGVRRLTTGGTDSDPAWSQDDSAIAFTSNRDGNDEIYVMKPDGGGCEQRPIPQPRAHARFMPGQSPAPEHFEGRRLAEDEAAGGTRIGGVQPKPG